MQKIEHFVSTPSCSIRNTVNNLTVADANSANTNKCQCPSDTSRKSTWFRLSTPSSSVTPSSTQANSNPFNVEYIRLYHCKDTN